MKFNNLFKRSILGDYDRDGVMNAFDCQPKNKKKQDTDEERRRSQEDWDKKHTRRRKGWNDNEDFEEKLKEIIRKKRERGE